MRLPAPFEPSLRVRLVLLGPSLPECDAIGFYIRARIAVLNSDSGSMHTPTGMALHGSRPAFWLDSFPGQKRCDLRLTQGRQRLKGRIVPLACAISTGSPWNLLTLPPAVTVAALAHSGLNCQLHAAARIGDIADNRALGVLLEQFGQNCSLPSPGGPAPPEVSRGGIAHFHSPARFLLHTTRPQALV